MNNNFYIWTLVLVLLQVLLFNNIELAGLINPYFYVYIILIMPLSLNVSIQLLIAFFAGLIIDVFSNTWGMHAAATTLVAFIRPYLLKLIISQEEIEKQILALNSIRLASYLKYAVSIVLIHHLSLFFLEAFSFANFGFTILKALCGSIVTLILIFFIEKVRKK